MFAIILFNHLFSNLLFYLIKKKKIEIVSMKTPVNSDNHITVNNNITFFLNCTNYELSHT